LNSIHDKICIANPPAIEPAGKPAAPAAGAPQRNQEGSPVTDTTSLSTLGDAVSTAAHSAAAQSSFRPELVASLKSRIAAGTYKPDPIAVANSVAAALKGTK
jgi:flagellar biosynthesis anti-sigma factor FlgM